MFPINNSEEVAQMDQVMISICCNAYNHAAYIRETLDSFLMQKTEYSYEILVYDDASTDNTAEIIREYERKYPDLIKPIYQTVNQYSRRLKPGAQNRARAKGKYIALCEGDDYWTDPLKLQKQIQYMEEHPDCTFCFTNAHVEYETGIKGQVIPWKKTDVYPKGKTVFNAGELELLGYIPTASFVFRNSVPLLDIPADAYDGDSYLKLNYTIPGYAYFIDEPTCVYRRSVSGSATAVWEKNKDKYTMICNMFIVLYSYLMEKADHRYDDVFAMRVCQWKIDKYCCLEDSCALKELAKSPEIRALKRGNLYSRIVYNMKCRHYDAFTKVKYYAKRMLKGLNK